MSVADDTLTRLEACGWLQGMSAKARARLTKRLKQLERGQKKLCGASVETMYPAFGEPATDDKTHDYDRLPDERTDPEWWLQAFARITDNAFQAAEVTVTGRTVRGKPKQIVAFTFNGRQYEHQMPAAAELRGVVNRALRDSGERRQILNTYPSDDLLTYAFVTMEAFKAAQADGLIPTVFVNPFSGLEWPWSGPTTGE